MVFEKYSNIRYQENPSSGNRAVLRVYGLTDMMELIAVFRNFANAPKNGTGLFLRKREDFPVSYSEVSCHRWWECI